MCASIQLRSESKLGQRFEPLYCPRRISRHHYVSIFKPLVFGSLFGKEAETMHNKMVVLKHFSVKYSADVSLTIRWR